MQGLPQAAKQELLYTAIYHRNAAAVQALVELGADPWGVDPNAGIRERPIYMSTKERCAGGLAGDCTFHEDLLAAMGYKRCRCEGCVACDNGGDEGCLRSELQQCVVPLNVDQEAEAGFPGYMSDDSDDDDDDDDASDDDVDFMG